jgi:hypothetical protein
MSVCSVNTVHLMRRRTSDRMAFVSHVGRIRSSLFPLSCLGIFTSTRVRGNNWSFASCDRENVDIWTRSPLSLSVNTQPRCHVSLASSDERFAHITRRSAQRSMRLFLRCRSGSRIDVPKRASNRITPPRQRVPHRRRHWLDSQPKHSARLHHRRHCHSIRCFTDESTRLLHRPQAS